MVEAYLLLGTNMGDRLSLLLQAKDKISREIGSISYLSAIYETAAWGVEQQPSYLNQVACVHTEFVPLVLLQKINAIEKDLGRERTEKWGPRPMDIDILLYGDFIIDEPNLQIPHPHLPNRRFALIPLWELAPHFIHPQNKKSITELLDETTDPLTVNLFNTNAYEQHEF